MKKQNIILIVDDENAESIKKNIERYSRGREREYFIIAYFSAKEAYEAIDNGLEFDLALIDLSMGERDSISFPTVGEPKVSRMITGQDIISLICEKDPHKPITAISGYSLDDGNYLHLQSLKNLRHFLKPALEYQLVHHIEGRLEER